MAFFPKNPASRNGTVQNVAIGAASVTLAAPFGKETYQIRLAATSACYYLVTEGTQGTTVPATATNGAYLPPAWVEYVTVTPGQVLTVIQASAVGTLNVVELS